jgi:tripartite-type tricarboxylate transporter receptor subunit TctC
VRTLKPCLTAAFSILAGALLSASAWANDYPARPVSLVIPYGAGGAFDITARLLASVSQKHLGQQLVPTLKPGGGATIGTAFVARAKPDGYTLLYAANSSLTIAPLIEDPGYSKDDFIPVGKITHLTYVVGVRNDKPWKNLNDLLAHVRNNPKNVVFGATGIPGLSTIGQAQMLKTAGINTLPPMVPFKGVGEQVLSVLRGDTDYMIQIYLGLLPQIRSKELRVLAVLDDARSPFVPDAPTAKELGFNISLNMWLSVLAPKGTPEPVLEKLSGAIAGMVKDPAFVEAMAKIDAPIIYQGRREFQAFWNEEYKSYGAMIEQQGLRKKKQ